VRTAGPFFVTSNVGGGVGGTPVGVTVTAVALTFFSSVWSDGLNTSAL